MINQDICTVIHYKNKTDVDVLNKSDLGKLKRLLGMFKSVGVNLIVEQE